MVEGVFDLVPLLGSQPIFILVRRARADEHSTVVQSLKAMSGTRSFKRRATAVLESSTSKDTKTLASR